MATVPVDVVVSIAVGMAAIIGVYLTLFRIWGNEARDDLRRGEARRNEYIEREVENTLLNHLDSMVNTLTEMRDTANFDISQPLKDSSSSAAKLTKELEKIQDAATTATTLLRRARNRGLLFLVGVGVLVLSITIDAYQGVSMSGTDPLTVINAFYVEALLFAFIFYIMSPLGKYRSIRRLLREKNLDVVAA